MTTLMNGSTNSPATRAAPAVRIGLKGLHGPCYRPAIAWRRADRPGAVAGTVLNCARRSAALTTAELARACSVSDRTLRAWDEGRSPLSSAPLPDIQALTIALVRRGASLRLVVDLEAAAWCDLVINAISDGDDIVCLVADPVADEPRFRELITWAVIGNVPARFRPFAGPGPLLTDRALADHVIEVLTALHPASVETRWLHF